jgi:predicted DNA-binding transcriptional regulator YafY
MMMGAIPMGVKKNPDATPSEKLLNLYTGLLLRNREVSLSELARELDCSKQTICRLIDQLEASRFGKLIRLKRGREAVYCFDRPKRLPQLSLDAEGLYQLALCRDFMIHLLPEAMRKNVETTLRQASAYLSERDDSEEGAFDFLGSAGNSYAKGHIDYTPFQGIWRTLIRAIQTRKICKVSYQSSPKGKIRTFGYAPKLMAAYHETIRFSGWLVTEDGSAAYDHPTVLLLHRMREVLATRKSAEHLPVPKEEHEGAFGLIADKHKHKPFSVSVRFTPFAAPYAAEREWSADQTVKWNDDGGAVLTMTTQSSVETVSWLLGFGDEAELISPQWLREEVAKKVRALAAIYE